MAQSVKARRHGPRMHRVARETFGYESLRPGQEEAIQSALSGRDTLCVMPTGAGKSAIYQIAAVLTPGSTIVVSPLIALQRDQLEAIEAQQVAGAAVVNSFVPEAERHEALEDLREGELEFLFLAPEQFNREEVLERVRAAPPSLFVVDEAHCISHWGHDFRPDYLKLGAVVEALAHPTVLALTATASPRVREEIVERLGMRNPRIIVGGFDRPNIWLSVESYADETSKTAALLEAVAESERPGLVYVSTRKQAEALADMLRERGERAVPYHAGMRSAERSRIQTAFMQGDEEIVVATSAFGMGIDKPDVRFVFHHAPSSGVDAYYQEIGRAGRDGEEAVAILFYRSQDLNLHKFFAGGGQVDAAQVEQVVQLIQERGEPVDPKELREETDLSKTKIARAITGLHEVGAVEVLATGEVAPARGDVDATRAAEEAKEAQDRRRRAELSRIEFMRGYAETPGCRRKYLLNYFGEDAGDRCGFCDNCETAAMIESEVEQAAALPREGSDSASKTTTRPRLDDVDPQRPTRSSDDVSPSAASVSVPITVMEKTEADRPFALKSWVHHKEWGKGMVLRYDGEKADKIVVVFEEAGYKTLALEHVLSRKLLEPLG